MFVGTIGGAFGELENTMKLSDLKLKGNEPWEVELLEVLKDQPISQAVGFCQALANGIGQHLSIRNKDVKVKELEMKLL